MYTAKRESEAMIMTRATKKREREDDYCMEDVWLIAIAACPERKRIPGFSRVIDYLFGS